MLNEQGYAQQGQKAQRSGLEGKVGTFAGAEATAGPHQHIGPIGSRAQSRGEASTKSGLSAEIKATYDDLPEKAASAARYNSAKGADGDIEVESKSDLATVAGKKAQYKDQPSVGTKARKLTSKQRDRTIRNMGRISGKLPQIAAKRGGQFEHIVREELEKFLHA